MIVPGSNLLGLALTVIGSTGAEWHRYIGREPNAVGQFVDTYAEPVALWGSWQPVPKEKYTDQGLDLAKTYFAFYVSAAVESIEREQPGDILVVGGQRYKVESSGGDWYKIDGWRGILCVEIGEVTP